MKDLRALSAPQRHLLAQIAGGARLKDHRDIEGGKRYTLTLDIADAIVIQASWVEGLLAQGLIDSNKKFPSATYWLTDAGKRAAADMAADRHGPLNT
jgi:predicted MarR family transcription regulator